MQIVVAVQSLSWIRLFVTPWAAAHQVPLSSTIFADSVGQNSIPTRQNNPKYVFYCRWGKEICGGLNYPSESAPSSQIHTLKSCHPGSQNVSLFGSTWVLVQLVKLAWGHTGTVEWAPNSVLLMSYKQENLDTRTYTQRRSCGVEGRDTSISQETPQIASQPLEGRQRTSLHRTLALPWSWASSPVRKELSIVQATQAVVLCY